MGSWEAAAASSLSAAIRILCDSYLEAVEFGPPSSGSGSCWMWSIRNGPSVPGGARCGRLIVFRSLFLAIATGVLAQQLTPAAGNWQSARNDTFTSPLHPVVTRAEFYLNIDVANDGSFRGEWGEYACVPSIGAYGYSTFPCRSSISNGRVSGKFGPAGQGVIELQRLGRSGLNWSTPSINELAIDLPRNWQGSEAVFHRARMTRDGKPRPPSPKPDEGPLLSAPALLPRVSERREDDAPPLQGCELVLEGVEAR